MHKKGRAISDNHIKGTSEDAMRVHDMLGKETNLNLPLLFENWILNYFLNFFLNPKRPIKPEPIRSIKVILPSPLLFRTSSFNTSPC
jgi:hypothetical protein